MALAAQPCPALMQAKGQPIRTHQTYGGSVCALCGSSEPAPTPEHTTDPEAFRRGEALAYRRVLSLLDGMPHEEATKGRDHGRGVAYAAQDIRNAVSALAEDSGLLDLL